MSLDISWLRKNRIALVLGLVLLASGPYGFNMGIRLTFDRITLLFIALPIFLFKLNTLRFNTLILKTTSFAILSTLATILIVPRSLVWLNYYMPVYIYCLIVFVLAGFLRKGEIDLILRLHVLLITVFAIYNFYSLATHGFLAVKLPFPTLLPEDIIHGDHKLNMNRTGRLWFPFDSAPRLSFVAGFLSLVMFLRLKMRRDWIYFICSIIVLIGTISRSGIFAFILVLSLGLTGQQLFVRRRNVLAQRNVRVLLSLCLIGVIILVSFIDVEPLLRLTKVDLKDNSGSGHLEIRIAVLSRMLSSGFRQVIFGWGIGGMRDLFSISSSHSSYFTILLERGVLGLWIYVLPLYYALIKIMSFPRRIKLFYGMILLFLSLTHLLYEASMFPIYWFYTGLLLNKNFYAQYNSSLL